jgi:hypothetical protein
MNFPFIRYFQHSLPWSLNREQGERCNLCGRFLLTRITRLFLHHRLSIHDTPGVVNFLQGGGKRVDGLSVLLGQESRVIGIPHFKNFHVQHPGRRRKDIRVNQGKGEL